MAIYEGAQPYVFLSYAHLDSDRVLPIFRRLEENHYRIWYDGGIEAGTEWPDYIAEHLEKSGCFLAFMSENYLNSRNCKQEINYALDLNIPILVIYMEDVTLTGGLRMRLGMVQALFHHRYGSENAFQEALFRSSLLSPCLINGKNAAHGQTGRSPSAATSSVTPPARAVPTGSSAAPSPTSRTPAGGRTSYPGYTAPTPASSHSSSSSTSAFSFTSTGNVIVSGNNHSVTVGGSGTGGSYSGGISVSSNTDAAPDAHIVVRSGQVYSNSGVIRSATVERGGTLVNSGVISEEVRLAGGTLQNTGIVSGSVTGTGFLRNTGAVSGYVSPDISYI